ncbi:C2H2 finger domain protein [Cordyceps javanica]|nr:C2H2 finger domain protein [Cordyceps javanica]
MRILSARLPCHIPTHSINITPPNNDPRIDARPHLQSNEMVRVPTTFTAVTETSTATTTAPEAAGDGRPNKQMSPSDEFCRSLAVGGLEQLEAPESAERQEAAEQLKALSHVCHRTGDAATNISPQRTALTVAMPVLHPGFRNLTYSKSIPVLDGGTGSARARLKRILGKPDIQCAHCSHALFKDASSLRKHTVAAHTRPFPCAFYFAGCTINFGSKNEWKRHITSQHLCLEYYRCSSCLKTTADKKDIEFNRKDLFTQHLRRMHGSFNRALTKENNDQQQSEWESYIKGMQQNCLVTRRRPPQQSSCPKPGCVNTFDGPTAWDEWATHVGRHMENGEGDDLGVNDWLQCYALEAGIIEKDGKGYKLRKSQL